MQTLHRTRRYRQMAEINVVPYIDVMLVLLVIFMVTAPMFNQGVEVELPRASATAIGNDEAEPLILTVDAAGRLYLNVGDEPETSLDEPTLMARAAAVLKRRPKTTVLVKGDAAVPYAKVVRGMALLQRAGAPKVGLMTQGDSAISGPDERATGESAKGGS